MGLLDWKPVDTADDDMFPNFDVSLSRTSSNEEEPRSSGSGASLSTTTSHSSTSSRNSVSDRSPPITIPSANARSPSPPSSARQYPPTHIHIPTAINNRKQVRQSTPVPARPRPNARRTTSTPIRGTPRPPIDRRRPSFDLFGTDSELQEAESKIGFCDICMKQCDIH